MIEKESFTVETESPLREAAEQRGLKHQEHEQTRAVLEEASKRLGFNAERVAALHEETITNTYPADCLASEREAWKRDRAKIHAALLRYLESDKETAACIRDYVADIENPVLRDAAKEFLKTAIRELASGLPANLVSRNIARRHYNTNGYKRLCEQELLALHERDLRNLGEQQKQRRRANGLPVKSDVV